MKFILLICLAALWTATLAQDKFTLAGQFKGYNGEIQLAYDTVVKTTTVVEGQFNFTGQLFLPAEAVFRIPSSAKIANTKFVIESGALTVRVDTTTRLINGKEYLEIKSKIVSGGLTNSMIKDFENNVHQKLLIASTQDVQREILTQEINKFCEAHPQELAPMYFVVQYISIFDKASLERIYNRLNNGLKNHRYGKEIKFRLEKLQSGLKGTSFMSFSFPDTAGKIFNSSSLKAKYILIDFWASWCVPCRIDHPNLVSVYSKFKPKGFEIISISLDGNRTAWVNAIRKDKLSWQNVSLLKAWDNPLVINYKINAVPDNFLLDAEGKIVARGLRPPALEQLLSELLN